MDTWEFILKILVSFFVMGGVLIGMLWFMKRRGLIPATMYDSEKMKVVSSVRLTPRAYLFAVRINGDKEIVVGVTEKNINLIYEIDEDKLK